MPFAGSCELSSPWGSLRTLFLTKVWLTSWDARLVSNITYNVYNNYAYIILPELVLCFQEHRELAREAVRKSLVLLKNGKLGSQPLLPLPKKVPKILVAGTHADNLGYQCGGWTIEWQGLSTNNLTTGVNNFLITTIYDDSHEINFIYVVMIRNHYSQGNREDSRSYHKGCL